ncbi:MAG: MaoC family dehydratase [Chloroflexi bacterium]|nr:MaoC family dehydratase [Chloroflexota bacterium]MCI0796923.1 MaoC family dehydratase [Chloroflexota bacterium]
MAQQTARDPEEAYVGKDLGSMEFTVTDDLVQHYFDGLEVDADWYTDSSLFGKALVPSMILTNADTGFSGAGFKDNFGNLWIRQEWDIRKPMLQGETYRRSSKIEDIYQWRDRTVVKQQVTLWSLDDEVMAIGVHHQSYLLGKSDQGTVKLRDPKSKEGVRKFRIPDGDAVGPVESDISLEMCGTFFHGNKNYHTDKDAAKELGFEEVVVGGRLTVSYIGDMMDRRFGKGWFEGGKLDVKFTNIVWPNDHVIARGVITDRVHENGGTRANVAVWMEKPDGTVCIVGTASALE